MGLMKINPVSSVLLSEELGIKLGRLTEQGKVLARKVFREIGAFRSYLPGSFNEYVTHCPGHLKILDLFFYDQRKKVLARKLLSARLRQIGRLGAVLEEQGINVRCLMSLLEDADISLPVQVAVEIDQNRVKKLKIYFSNVSKDTRNIVKVMARVSRILCQAVPADNLWMPGYGIDCIGIDLFADGREELKLYTFFQKECSFDDSCGIVRRVFRQYDARQQGLTRFFRLAKEFPCRYFGFLFRMDGSRVREVKCWWRIAELGLYRSTGLTLSYLTLSNGRIERYLRLVPDL